MLSLFKKDHHLEAARSLYSMVVDHACGPIFYLDYKVPDTFEGRFELVAMHSFLLIRILQPGVHEGLAEGQGKTGEAGFDDEQSTQLAHECKIVAQKFLDVMFDNMDVSLREMGVGDLSVAKKIRKVAEAFYGRAAAYSRVFGDDDQVLKSDGMITLLTEVIARNVYGVNLEEDACGHAGTMAEYMIRCAKNISDQPIGRIAKGIVHFPDPVNLAK